MLIYISAGAVRGGHITAHRKHVSSRMLHRLQHLPCYEITCNCSFNLPSSATDLIYWSSRCRAVHINEHPSDSFRSSKPTPDRARCGLTIPRELPLQQLKNIPVEEENHAAWQGFVHLQQVKPYLLRSQTGLQGSRDEQMQSYGLFQQESPRSLGLSPPGWFLRRWPAKPQPCCETPQVGTVTGGQREGHILLRGRHFLQTVNAFCKHDLSSSLFFQHPLENWTAAPDTACCTTASDSHTADTKSTPPVPSFAALHRTASH